MDSFNASSKKCGGCILVVIRDQIPAHGVWLISVSSTCSPARFSTRDGCVAVLRPGMMSAYVQSGAGNILYCGIFAFLLR